MRLFFFTILFSILFSSCKKNEISDSIDFTPNFSTYSSVKITFDSNCVGCHSSSQNSYIIDLTNYNSIKNYLDGTNTMIERLESEDEFYRMPPSGSLSEIEKQNLIDWINTGYMQ